MTQPLSDLQKATFQFMYEDILPARTDRAAEVELLRRILEDPHIADNYSIVECARAIRVLVHGPVEK